MAGTKSLTKKDLYYNVDEKSGVIAVNIAYVADAADGSVPDLVISSSENVSTWNAIKGMKFDHIITVGNHGGTEPTEDSDVYVYTKAAGVSKAIDLLLGAGVDSLDNTANRIVFPLVNSNKVQIPISDSLTVVVSNNSVNSAMFNIILVFKR